MGDCPGWGKPFAAVNLALSELRESIPREKDDRMALRKHKPRTKAAKKAKVKTVLGEHKRDTLRSSSGAKVTKRKQAVAIALSEAGLSKPKNKRKKR